MLSRGGRRHPGPHADLNFPGSPKSIREAGEAIAPALPHAVALLPASQAEHGTMAAEQPRRGDRRRRGTPAAKPPSAIAVDGARAPLRRARGACATSASSSRAGETLAVLGPNGAGKTTLLRVLATLLAAARGHGARARPRASRARRTACAPRVGLLGHEPLLYRDLSGARTSPSTRASTTCPSRDARIAELLEATGMARRADEPVRNLSRGMAQRLAVCRAVLHRPDAPAARRAARAPRPRGRPRWSSR